jgi:hypothetical protein
MYISPQMSTTAPKGPIQLTNQDLAEVLEALRESGPPSEGFERRQSTRVMVQTAVFAAPVIAGKPGPVRTLLTRDMSLMGIGLIQSTPIGEHEALILKLPKAHKKPIFVLARPVQCRQLAESIYAIGAQFVSVVQLNPSDTERFERLDAESRLRASVLN